MRRRCAETLRAQRLRRPGRPRRRRALPPYERPALSRSSSPAAREPAALALRDDGAYEERGIELALGRRVVRLDRRSALLDDGTRLPWDAVVLATGARARSLPGRAPLRRPPPANPCRRSRAPAELLPGRRLVVIGAGLVGSEVASTASPLGVDVVLADRELPLQGALGADVGSLLASRQREHGIDLHLGARAIGFRASAEDVEAVVLEDGSTFACDVALVAIGVEPAADSSTGRAGRSQPTPAAERPSPESTQPATQRCRTTPGSAARPQPITGRRRPPRRRRPPARSSAARCRTRSRPRSGATSSGSGFSSPAAPAPGPESSSRATATASRRATTMPAACESPGSSPIARPSSRTCGVSSRSRGFPSPPSLKA